MARELLHSVIAGGVVYPAGTTETDELAGRISDEHWSPDPMDGFDQDHENAVVLKEMVEYLVESHSADQDRPVADLFRDALEVLGEPVATPEPDATPQGSDEGKDVGDSDQPAPAPSPDPAPDPARISGDYDDHKVAELAAEIETRNEGRDAADRILPTGKNKPDLVAALVADDQA